MNYADAKRYVGTTFTSGLAQMGLLVRTGLVPSDYVLEVGCGALHTAKAIMPALENGHYCGIDPNAWLRVIAIGEDAVLRKMVELYEPCFDSNMDFDGSVFKCGFNRVISHSILSHVSQKQLGQFLENTGKVLLPFGYILASIRLAGKDTMAEKWTYPSAVFFKWETVEKTAVSAGLKAEHHPEYREWYQSYCQEEIHDWIIFRKME